MKKNPHLKQHLKSIKINNQKSVRVNNSEDPNFITSSTLFEFAFRCSLWENVRSIGVATEVHRSVADTL